MSRVIIEAIEYQIQAYQERLGQEDLDEDEASEIINDSGFLQALCTDLKKNLSEGTKPDVIKSSDRSSNELMRQVLQLSMNERLLAAQKAGQKIAVDIKSFLRTSEVTEFHLALGQTLNYRSALRKTQPERVLYLAIPFDAYRDFFIIQFIQDVIAEYQVKLLIFDPLKEEVVLWKE